MTRYFAILALCSLLACELGSWLGSGRCSVLQCSAEMSATCSFSSSYSVSAPTLESDFFDFFAEKDGCGEQSDSPLCVPCSPNCCLFIVPEFRFELRMPLSEASEQPKGEQHRYPQSFHPSVWHPPARLV